MADSFILRRLDINSGNGGGNGIYPIGENGRPTGDVIVPSGVTILGKYIFTDNPNVTSITFPEGLISTDTEACENASNLESVSLPSTFKSFGTSTF